MHPTPVPADPQSLLERNRRDIEALDRRILHLVCERLELARQIGELKASLGVPLRNFGVEADVHRRFEEASRFLGLEPGLGRDLARFLIDKAVEEQATVRDAAWAGDAVDAVVVGGGGGMGRWLCRFLAGQGHRVSVVDPAGSSAPFEMADGDEVAAADLIFVSVPMRVCPDVLVEIAALAPRGVVAEICSLKGHLRETAARLRGRGLRLVSCHPMFGPEVRMLEGRSVVFCTDGDPADVAVVRRLFAETSARLVDLDPEEHDRRMGLVLGLAHLQSLVFARTLAHSGVAAGELAEVAGVTFARQIATTREVAAENPDLYFDIQALNRLTPQVGGWMACAIAEWLAAVADGDRERFTAMMQEARLAVDGIAGPGGGR